MIDVCHLSQKGTKKSNALTIGVSTACDTLSENRFLHLKRWRGIATRYAKNTSPFLAAIQIRCIALWANQYELEMRFRAYP